MHVVQVVFTTVAVGLNVAFVWPQAVRLVRTRDLHGVSPATWAISTTLFAVWAAFAARTGFWALFAANASSLAAAVVIVAVGTRSGWSPRWALACLGGAAAAAAAGVWAPAVLAVVMTGAGVALRLPQLVTLARSPSTAGVSSPTWWLSAATAGSWLVVSTSRGATAVMVANSTALVSTLVLLAVLYWRRRQEARLPTPA